MHLPTPPASAAVQLSISIVSHAQMPLVLALLADLHALQADTQLEVLLTLNTCEEVPANLHDFAFPIKLLRNPQPQGFSANHNRAFAQAQGGYFCVLNPDIRLQQNPFAALIRACSSPGVAIVAPTITNSSGQYEDSARKFPTPWRITQRLLNGRRLRDYTSPADAFEPDWVAGMFMLLRAPVYQELGGFDERYFLYLEDVDLCARARLLGLRTVQLPLNGVVHDAQRKSQRDPKYRRWHLMSMLRFFCSAVFLRLQWQRLAGMRSKQIANAGP